MSDINTYCETAAQNRSGSPMRIKHVIRYSTPGPSRHPDCLGFDIAGHPALGKIGRDYIVRCKACGRQFLVKLNERYPECPHCGGVPNGIHVSEA